MGPGSHSPDPRKFRRSGLGFDQAGVFDQFRLIISQVILDHLNSPQAGRHSFLILKKPVMRQGFPNFHYFDMAFFGFPELSFDQRGDGC
jgi:hypothetical protein